MDNQTSGSDGNSKCYNYHHHKSVRVALVVVLVLLAVFLFAQTLKTFKEYHFVGGGVPAVTTISVSGTGETFAIPDTTEFTFTVNEEGSTVGEAQQKATKVMEQALAVVSKGGVEKENMKTIAYDVHPKYSQVECLRYPCNVESKIIGFESAQTIQVKMKDADKAGVLLSQLAEVGVQNISSLSFTVEDEDVVKKQAREMAIADAKKKADELSRSLGVKLVRIVNFNEDGNQPMPYYGKNMALGMGGDAVAPQAAPLPQGENKIVSNITITYEIR